jgi:hypothetical protein
VKELHINPAPAAENDKIDYKAQDAGTQANASILHNNMFII